MSTIESIFGDATAPSAGVPASMDEEIHIAGVLVHTRQPHTLAACAAMSRMPGVELSQTTPEGRVILVLEGRSSSEILAMLDAIRALEGVLNVALVYQHAESASAMQEEMGP